jgi:hypothetical protein
MALFASSNYTSALRILLKVVTTGKRKCLHLININRDNAAISKLVLGRHYNFIFNINYNFKTHKVITDPG